MNKSGSFNCYNIFSVIAILLTNFEEKNKIKDYETIKNHLYKIMNNTQKFIGKINKLYFNYLEDRLMLNIDDKEINSCLD